MGGKRWDQYRLARDEAGATDYKTMPDDRREAVADDARFSAAAEAVGAHVPSGRGAARGLRARGRGLEPLRSPTGAVEIGTDVTLSRTLPPSRWARELGEFTRRNAGRPTLLEVDELEVGAQPAGVELLLRGVAYDPRDRRVEIMFGDLGAVEAHLTHSIGNVRSIDLLTTPDGRDRVLRIACDDGQALLRLLSA